MAIGFNADEIFEIAEQIERNGAKFYRKAADGAALAGARAMLLELASMEDDHLKTFAAMRSHLTGAAKAQATFDPDDESALYLQALADGKVFDIGADPSQRLTGGETLQDVLTTAIGLEKDSVVFYLAMRDMVAAAAGKDQMSRIIKEEMGHIRLLSDKKASV